MSNIDQIQQKIGSLYQGLQPSDVVISFAMVAYDWFHFADSYIRSAALLESKLPQHWLPVLQLSGHAIECALKGCLVAANVGLPKSHDLIVLAKLGQENGYQLTDPEIAFLVHLSHYYHRDLATGTKHKARYPSNERLGGSVPEVSMFVATIQSLMKQATHRTTSPFREMFEAILESFGRNEFAV